jgi:hypothetical protein
LRPQGARVGAPVGICRHPAHLTMRACSKEFVQSWRRKRNRVGPDHAGEVEALRPCGCNQFELQRRSV